jgi:primosomal protein N''
MEARIEKLEKEVKTLKELVAARTTTDSKRIARELFKLQQEEIKGKAKILNQTLTISVQGVNQLDLLQQSVRQQFEKHSKLHV